MSFPLQHNVADQIILLGPFCEFDANDNLIPAETLTIAATDIRLRKAGSAAEVSASSGATHIADGRYAFTANATDCNTLGPMEVSVYLTGTLPFTLQCEVLTEAAYKLRYGTGTIDGIETLKTRVPGIVRTAAQDDSADTALTSGIASAATAAGDAQTAAQAAALAAGDVSGRLTAARAGYLDKLNVTGDISTFNPTTQQVSLAQTFPTNFQLLSIDGTGKVTTSNPAAGSGSSHTAQDVANLILANPANKLVTDATGRVQTSNALTTLGAAAPANWINAAAIASNAISAAKIATGALNGKGDWNIGKAGYSLTQAFPSNFASLVVDGTGKVTTSNPAVAGGDNVWSTGQRDQVLALATNYVAPDNAAIAAIQAKTNNLPSNPASTSDVNINFTPSINVSPTVLSQASVDAITNPIISAIGNIEAGEGGGTGVATADQIAARLFADPNNKLYVSAEGYVIASNAGGGTGLHEIAITVYDQYSNGIENVPVFIPGTSRQYKTDMYGEAKIYVNNGNYVIRFDAESIGYQDTDDVLVGVLDGDEIVEVVLVPKVAESDQPVGTIKLPLKLVDQSNQALPYIRVNAILTEQYEVIEDDALALNATGNKLTDVYGRVNLYLFPSQEYVLRVIMPDLTEVTIPITTPEQGVAVLSQVIQV